MQQEKQQQKSRARAIACFACGMVFWIPLLNVIFGAFGIYFGISALSRIRKSPDKYSGTAFAAMGLALCLVVYMFYFLGIGLCISGNGQVCAALGLESLSS